MTEKEKAIEDETIELPIEPAEKKKPHRGRIVVITVAALALLAAGGIAWRTHEDRLMAEARADCAAASEHLRTATNDYNTLLNGQAASMAAILLAAGEKGKRFALPHARILIHQPLGGFQGQATDIDIQAREILRLKDELNKILSELTGQQLEKIMNDTERDYFMTSAQAKEYGLIDEIVVRKPVLSMDNK